MSLTNMKIGYATVSITSHMINQSVKSYTFSTRYINMMVRATVLNILYHRLNMDESEFVNKSFDSVPFRSFNRNSTCRYIKEFHSYMNGFQEAFNSSRLKSLYLILWDDDNNRMAERYQFSFQYANESEAEEARSQRSSVVREFTTTLLTALNQLGNYDKLLQKITVRCELVYVPGTPRDYQPTGFRAEPEENYLMNRINKNMRLFNLMPTIDTGFHVFKCEVFGAFHKPSAEDNVIDLLDSPPVDANDNILAITETPHNETIENEGEQKKKFKRRKSHKGREHKSKKQKREPLKQQFEFKGPEIPSKIPKEEFKSTKALQPMKGKQAYATSSKSIISVSDSSEATEIARTYCYCELPHEDTQSVEKIKCSLCSYNYHLPCLGYLSAEHLPFKPSQFRCNRCTNSGTKKKRDETIRAPRLCRIRLILACIYTNTCCESLKPHLYDSVLRIQELGYFVEDQNNPGMYCAEEFAKATFIINETNFDLKRFDNVDLEGLFAPTSTH